MSGPISVKAALGSTAPISGVQVQGWVRTRRDSKDFSFIELNDGSCLRSLQIIAKNTLSNYAAEVMHLTAGCSVIATGTLAQSQGKPVFYLIPKATLQIETPLAAVNGSNKAAAQQFVRWLYTPAAQTIWAQNGFRSVVPSVEKRYLKQFPPRPQLFRIGYVGGWPRVNKSFFDPTNGIVAKIEQSLGVSTGG